MNTLANVLVNHCECCGAVGHLRLTPPEDTSVTCNNCGADYDIGQFYAALRTPGVGKRRERAGGDDPEPAAGGERR